jgi:tetratricopeptide (TPR) repeat protein
VAATGRLRAEGEALVLELVVADADSVRRVSVREPRDDPGRLADRAAAVLAGWYGFERRSLPPLDLRGVDAGHARAVGLVGAGLPFEALAALEAEAALDRLTPRAQRLLAALRSALEGVPFDGEATLEDAAVIAVAALSVGDADGAMEAFERAFDGGLPVAAPWIGALAHNLGDPARAVRAFDAAAAVEDYDFGRASRAAYSFSVGDERAALHDLATLLVRAEALTIDPSGALAGSIAATLGGHIDLEEALLVALGRVAPFLAYAFERRSFIAFDADDALTAGESLAVAVELEPDSDLYWTNYGWALYLLGFLPASEDASRRALALDPSQFIARYNLALVEVVTDRLDAGLGSYREALRYDVGVDPEALADLVDAEVRYPDAVGVPFALGVLLEVAGDRAASADAFERYVEAVALAPGAPAADPARAREARERAVALRAPLPPIGIDGPVTFRLGRRGPVVEVARPGDPLVVAFEVTTDGDQLPRSLRATVLVQDAEGREVAAAERVVDVPIGAIGYVVDVARVDLPIDLAGGRYTVRVLAEGDGLEADALRSFEVGGAPDVVRILVGRDVTMLALDTNQPLYGARDVGREGHVFATLLAELRATADAAEEVLEPPEEGRFVGLSGGAIFTGSTVHDVRDFITFVLESGAQDTSFTFVDGYADWAVFGAPTGAP